MAEASTVMVTSDSVIAAEAVPAVPGALAKTSSSVSAVSSTDSSPSEGGEHGILNDMIESAKYVDAYFYNDKELHELPKLFAKSQSIYQTIPPNCLPSGAMDLLAKIFCSLSSRPTNRSHLVQANVPATLCMMLINAVTWKSCMNDALKERTMVDDNFSVNMELLLLDEEEESAYISKIAQSTLNALANFLTDLGSPKILSGTSALKSTLIYLMTHAEMINAIKTILTLPRGPARLAGLRVLSALTEWNNSGSGAAIDNLVASDILPTLVSIAYESSQKIDEFDLFTSSSMAAKGTQGAAVVYSGHMLGQGQGQGQLNPLSKPKLQARESSHGSIRSVGADDSNFLEETLFVCEILANVCQYNEDSCLRLFKDGLPKIVLKLVRSGHQVVSHQSLRCLSAMCVVARSLPREAVKNGTETDKTYSVLYSKSLNEQTEIEFVEALTVFNKALTHPNPNVQKEALLGIARLAAHDLLSVGIVLCETLRKLILLIIDHESEHEVRELGELVLKQLGFENGRLDSDLVANDWYIFLFLTYVLSNNCILYSF